jgi:hypothetical protein
MSRIGGSRAPSRDVFDFPASPAFSHRAAERSIHPVPQKKTRPFLAAREAEENSI